MVVGKLEGQLIQDCGYGLVQNVFVRSELQFFQLSSSKLNEGKQQNKKTSCMKKWNPQIIRKTELTTSNELHRMLSFLLSVLPYYFKKGQWINNKLEVGTVERRVVPLRPAHAALVEPVCGTRGTGLRNTRHWFAERGTGLRNTWHRFAEHVALLARNTVPFLWNAAHTQNCGTSLQTGATTLSFLLSSLPNEYLTESSYWRCWKMSWNWINQPVDFTRKTAIKYNFLQKWILWAFSKCFWQNWSKIQKKRPLENWKLAKLSALWRSVWMIFDYFLWSVFLSFWNTRASSIEDAPNLRSIGEW